MDDLTTTETDIDEQTTHSDYPTEDFYSDPSYHDDYINGLIEDALQDYRSSYKTIAAIHGDEQGEYRIYHEATLGDLLICFLLVILIALTLLRWFFKAVWGR